MTETNGELKKLSDSIREISQFRQIYSAALNEIETKFRNLDQEFRVNYEHNPIHHIEKRLKSMESIVQKMERLGIPITISNAQDNIHDIAGIRIICNYLEDLYIMERLLLLQNDVQLIDRNDYIKQPKESGYRSLHLIISIPIFLSKGPLKVPVEIQFRTVAMDMWASLEHEIYYKSSQKNLVSAENRDKLIQCSYKLNEIEKMMQEIHKESSIYTDFLQKK